MSEITGLSNVQENHQKYAHLFEENASGDMLNTETFFNLLMAEMSNQDPLEPMSNTEFIAQMAQFTALQAQQDALKYNTSNFASSLVGKQLTINTGALTPDAPDGLAKGICTGVSMNGKEVKVVVNGKEYLISSVRSIAEADKKDMAEEPTHETDLSEATALIGKEVTVKVVENGNDYYDSGIVDAVEVTDGIPQIVIGGYVYYVDEVVQVKDPVVQTDENETLSQILDILAN